MRPVIPAKAGTQVSIASLASHPGLVPELVEAFVAEWPEWAAKTPRAEIARGFECAAAGELPQVFVALDGGRPAGSIALRPWFSDEPIPETPWVRGLLVLRPYRGGRAYRLLADAAEDAARAMGYGTLYAATTSIEALIRRRGWETFRHVERDGTTYAWLRKAL